MTNVDNLSQLPPEMLMTIALDLPLKDVTSLCQTSPKLAELCNNEKFWKLRLEKDYPLYVPRRRIAMKYKRYYELLVKTRNFKLSKIPGETQSIPLIEDSVDVDIDPGSLKSFVYPVPFFTLTNWFWTPDIKIYYNGGEYAFIIKQERQTIIGDLPVVGSDIVNFQPEDLDPDFTRSGLPEGSTITAIKIEDLPALLRQIRDKGYLLFNGNSLHYNSYNLTLQEVTDNYDLFYSGSEEEFWCDMLNKNFSKYAPAQLPSSLTCQSYYRMLYMLNVVFETYARFHEQRARNNILSTSSFGGKIEFVYPVPPIYLTSKRSIIPDISITKFRSRAMAVLCKRNTLIGPTPIINIVGTAVTITQFKEHAFDYIDADAPELRDLINEAIEGFPDDSIVVFFDADKLTLLLEEIDNANYRFIEDRDFDDPKWIGQNKDLFQPAPEPQSSGVSYSKSVSSTLITSSPPKATPKPAPRSGAPKSSAPASVSSSTTAKPRVSRSGSPKSSAPASVSSSTTSKSTTTTAKPRAPRSSAPKAIATTPKKAALVSWEDQLAQDFHLYIPDVLPENMNAQQYYNILRRTRDLNLYSQTKEAVISNITSGTAQSIGFVFPLPPLYVADNVLLPDLLVVKHGVVVLVGWNNRLSIAGTIPSIEPYITCSIVGPITTNTPDLNINEFINPVTGDYPNDTIQKFSAIGLTTACIFPESNLTSFIEDIYSIGYQSLPYSIQGKRQKVSFHPDHVKRNSDILQILNLSGEWRQRVQDDYPQYFSDYLPKNVTYEDYYSMLNSTQSLIDVQGNRIFDNIDPEQPTYPMSLIFPIPLFLNQENRIYGDILINSFDDGKSLIVAISQREMIVGLVPPIGNEVETLSLSDIGDVSEQEQFQEHLNMLAEGGYQTMLINAGYLISLLYEAQSIGYMRITYDGYSVELSPTTIAANRDLFQ